MCLMLHKKGEVNVFVYHVRLEYIKQCIFDHNSYS